MGGVNRKASPNIAAVSALLTNRHSRRSGCNLPELLAQNDAELKEGFSQPLCNRGYENPYYSPALM